MKKHTVGLVMILLVQTMHAMEIVPLKLSKEDDEKALGLAKLFNKYPKGYGESDQDKKQIVSRMQSFEQSQEYKDLYVRVKKYQKTLQKIEKKEICNFMYTYKEEWPEKKTITDGKEYIEKAFTRDFAPDLRQKVFTNLLYLYGDAQQYYAADNMLKFITIGDKGQFQDCSLAYDCKQYFLNEMNKGNDRMLSFSNNGDDDEAYPSDESKVTSSIIVDIKDNVYCSKKMTMTFTRKAIRELVSFLKTKKARIEEFENLFNNCIKNLSLEDQERGLESFFQLSEQLKGHNNKRINTPNDKSIIVKGYQEPEYILLSLEEVFTTNAVDYDAGFYNQLANSNGLGASRIEFDQEKLDKFQKFPPTHRNKLADTKIKVHHKGCSFIDYIIIHVPLLVNSLTPDVISYYINDIASMIGCNTGTTAVLGCLGCLIMSYPIGEHIVPQVDAKCNSHMSSIKACIKEAKVRLHDKRGWSFFITHIVHRLLSLAGNKCLSFQSLPVKVFGGIAHAMRVPLHLATWYWVDCADTRHHQYSVSDLKEKTEV